MAAFNEIQKRNKAKIQGKMRAIHGDPKTGKLKQRAQTVSISGKRKRKLLKIWRRDQKEVIEKGLITMDVDMEAAGASGYESEDNSVNEVKVDSSGLLTSEEDSIEGGGENLRDDQFNKRAKTKATDHGASKSEERTLNSNDPIQSDFADYILQCKSVFKCRLCPRIVCLSVDTVKAHLNSKRHARSKKLLGEGRLKLMLNSDGEIEEDLETHAERHMRTVAIAQKPVAPAKKDQGRQRQNRRRKKKQLRNSSNKGKPEESSKNPKKKQRKNEV